MTAVAALAGIAFKNPENQRLIVQAQGVPPLVALLRCEDLFVRQTLARMLVHLIRSHLNHPGLIAQLGSIAALGELLETRAQEEEDVGVKEDLQYILAHWQKKPESDHLNEDPCVEDVASPSL